MARHTLITLLVFVIVLPVGCTHRTKNEAQGDLRPLQDATAALNRVSRGPNAIPDAVLNATKCVVVIPSVPGNALETTTGVANCRESQGWSAPWTITFSGQSARPHGNDLFILVMTDSGMQALRTRRLHVTPSPAPLVSTNPIPTQLDLARESVSYEAVEGALSSSTASGIVTRDAGPLAIGGGVGPADPVLIAYETALKSLFNGIVPTGIVIHHTAVLPAQGRPPRNTGEVDRYHQTRGFQITCQGRTYHVAYHYLILPDGRVQSGRPERCEGAHAQGYNSYLGISVVGDFSRRDNPVGRKGLARPTEQQIASLIRLCRELQARYRIPLQHIVRHSDISSTNCPGNRFPFDTFLRTLANESAAVKSGK